MEAATAEATADVHIRPTTIQDATPLSTCQAEIWLAMQLEDTGSAFNLPMRIRACGDVDVARLHEAFVSVLLDHEQLRTVVDADAPVQRVTADAAPGGPALVEPGDADGAFEAMAGEPFALGGPLYRFAYVRHDESNVELLLAVHHLIFDGTSQKLFVDAIAERYANGRSGGGGPSYAAYAAQRHDGVRSVLVPAWSAALATLRAAEAQATERFGALQWVQFLLSGPVLERLKDERRALGCSLAELWLALFSSATQAAGSVVPVIRLGIDSRPSRFLATIGNFTNVLPLPAPSLQRLDARIGEAKTALEWAKAAKAEPIGTLLAREDRAALSSAPMMTHRRFSRSAIAGGCVMTADPFVPVRTAKAPLVLQSIDYGDEVAVRLEFDSRALGIAQRGAVVARFKDELSQLGLFPVANHGRPRATSNTCR
jgi:hypothetical protein